jgi:hypothetical protein
LIQYVKTRKFQRDAILEPQIPLSPSLRFGKILPAYLLDFMEAVLLAITFELGDLSVR